MNRRLVPFLLFLLPYLVMHAQEERNHSKIDRHARRAPDALQEDLPALTAYLVEGAGDDFERVRGFFFWITIHIAYDEEAFRNDRRRINRNIEDILRRQRAVCMGYAQLFQAMCRQAGIPSEVVEGYSKGTLTALPDLSKPDHAWNAVNVEGKWYLVDATWGSSVLQRSNEFAQMDHETYFLSPPERFIITHLPSTPKWQLLDCPVSAALFQEPADSITAFLAQCDSQFAFRDSIRQWQALPRPLQRLQETRNAYHFNPTPPNRNALGHAYMDYAGALSDSTETLQYRGELDQMMQVQQQVIGLCEKARTLADTLYGWQKELHINALMNQAVAFYQKAVNETDTTSEQKGYRQAQQRLLKAQEIIDELPDNSLYGLQMKRRSTEYLEIIQQYLEK